LIISTLSPNFQSVFVTFSVNLFFQRLADQTTQPIIMLDGSNDAAWNKELPFGVSMLGKSVSG
jgi:hypothetical protein